MTEAKTIGMGGVARLGLVQAALGAMVVLATSSMNRVMVVEIGLPATIPGVLVALHYGVQVLRPAMGHASDGGGRRTPWIFGGMVALVAGALLAAASIGVMRTDRVAGVALAVAAYAIIGGGVGAAGTSVLVLLAKMVAPARRAVAATVVWMMMIFGIALTAKLGGAFLDPFSASRLLAVTAVVGATALTLTIAGVAGIEGAATAAVTRARGSFADAARAVWSEPRARAFTVFVFVSMLAYSAQELILEPFAATVFGLTPGRTAGLAGTQHAGVLIGMVLVALIGWRTKDAYRGPLVLAGCVGSALMSAVLATASVGAPLEAELFALGAANGVFAVSAIGAMIGLANEAGDGREGLRLGIWGGAQAVAFACGGVVGPLASDLFRAALGDAAGAYGAVFVMQAALFALAALTATKIFPVISRPRAALVGSHS